MSYEIKDSGARDQLAGGMIRETESADKLDYTLVLDGPMHERWAQLLDKSARTKYAPRNWMRATTSTDLVERGKVKDRYKRSAYRHLLAWLRGETDEDHAAAVFFNINGYEAMIATDDAPQSDSGVSESSPQCPVPDPDEERRRKTETWLATGVF